MKAQRSEEIPHNTNNSTLDRFIELTDNLIHC